MDFGQQPTPTGADSEPDVAGLVIQDIEGRARLGEAKYGQRLRPHNGRNALIDAYEEALDLVMYLRQRIEEETVVVLQRFVFRHIAGERLRVGDLVVLSPRDGKVYRYDSSNPLHTPMTTAFKDVAEGDWFTMEWPPGEQAD